MVVTAVDIFNDDIFGDGRQIGVTQNPHPIFGNRQIRNVDIVYIAGKANPHATCCAFVVAIQNGDTDARPAQGKGFVDDDLFVKSTGVSFQHIVGVGRVHGQLNGRVARPLGDIVYHQQWLEIKGICYAVDGDAEIINIAIKDKPAAPCLE